MRKIEVNEDDLKKIILILKLGKSYMNIPPSDLTLGNLWRVSGKLADKLMKKAGLTLVTNKGRTSLKPVEDIPSEVTETKEIPANEESTTEVEEPMKVPRCRKRKSK